MPVPRPAQECPDTQLAMQDFTTRGRAGSCPREDALAPVQALLRNSVPVCRIDGVAIRPRWAAAALLDCNRTRLSGGRGGARCIQAASVEGSGAPLLRPPKGGAAL